MSKVPANLHTYLNKHINQLCPFTIGKQNGQNHCAHFVSHVMAYELAGPTCKNFTWADKQKPSKGATIRVDDLFKNSPETGLLSDKPDFLKECLLFVTRSSNVKNQGGKLIMGNQPKKHVGILTHGKVWNYSNSNNLIVVDSLDIFIRKFSNAYGANNSTVEFYYGKFI